MPLFYEITAPRGEKNHLLATLHVNDEEVNKLPENVMRAFQFVSMLIVESDISEDKINQAMQAHLIHWKKHYGALHLAWLSRPQYVDAVVKQIAHYYPWYTPRFLIRDKVKTLPPMALSELITARYRDKHAFLDKNLIQLAKRINKPVYYLETIESQVDVA